MGGRGVNEAEGWGGRKDGRGRTEGMPGKSAGVLYLFDILCLSNPRNEGRGVGREGWERGNEGRGGGREG